jgi:hypothetical protein
VNSIRGSSKQKLQARSVPRRTAGTTRVSDDLSRQTMGDGAENVPPLGEKPLFGGLSAALNPAQLWQRACSPCDKLAPNRLQ